MGSATTFSDYPHRYLQDWLQSNSSNVVTTNGHPAPGEDNDGIAAQLYTMCQHLLKYICTQYQKSSPERLQTQLLKEELTKLYLWGQDYGNGELDAALEYSDDTHCVVLAVLEDIAQLLLREASCSSHTVLEPAHVKQCCKEFEYLIERTRCIITDMCEVVEELGSDDSYDTDEDGASDVEDGSDPVRDLRRSISHLIELQPALQQNVLCVRRARVEISCPSVVPSNLCDPASIYASLIRETYKDAQDYLVDRLGESNWRRHKMVREPSEHMIRRHSGSGEHVEGRRPFLEDEGGRPESHEVDTSASLAVNVGSAFLDNPPLWSNVEDEQSSKRFPSFPEEVAAGRPFQCRFCRNTVHNVKTHVDWKSHVFADIRPYICTFVCCTHQSPTPAAWADHEIQEHRNTCARSCLGCAGTYNSEHEWTEHSQGCQLLAMLKFNEVLEPQVGREQAGKASSNLPDGEECPLCRHNFGDFRLFGRHITRHMEDIALMALPQEFDQASEADPKNIDLLSFRYTPGYTQCPEPTTIEPNDCGVLQQSRLAAAEQPLQHSCIDQGPLTPYSTPAPDDSDGLNEKDLKVKDQAYVDQSDTTRIGYEAFDQSESKQPTLDTRKLSAPAENPDIISFACNALSIGTWRRVASDNYDLEVFWTVAKACLTYYFNIDGHGHIMEYPFAYIESIDFEKTKQSQEWDSQNLGLRIKLNHCPRFFSDTADRKGSQPCNDFTKHKQASQIMVHYLAGPHTILANQLAWLKSLYVFQNRQSHSHELSEPYAQRPLWRPEVQASILFKDLISTSAFHGSVTELPLSQPHSTTFLQQISYAQQDNHRRLLLLEQQNKQRLQSAQQDITWHGPAESALDRVSSRVIEGFSTPPNSGVLTRSDIMYPAPRSAYPTPRSMHSTPQSIHMKPQSIEVQKARDQLLTPESRAVQVTRLSNKSDLDGDSLRDDSGTHMTGMAHLTRSSQM